MRKSLLLTIALLAMLALGLFYTGERSLKQAPTQTLAPTLPPEEQALFSSLRNYGVPEAKINPLLNPAVIGLHQANRSLAPAIATYLNNGGLPEDVVEMADQVVRDQRIPSDVKDDVTREWALFLLAYRDGITRDTDCFSKLLERGIDFDEALKRSLVMGVEGGLLEIKQIGIERNGVLEYWPDKEIEGPNPYFHTAQDYFYGWLADRRNNGLPNTVEQFYELDEALARIWDKWDLIRFIVGYERGPMGDK